MYHLEFHRIHDYSNEKDGISVPVLLKAGSRTVPFSASVDTGARLPISWASTSQAVYPNASGRRTASSKPSERNQMPSTPLHPHINPSPRRIKIWTLKPAAAIRVPQLV